MHGPISKAAFGKACGQSFSGGGARRFAPAPFPGELFPRAGGSGAGGDPRPRPWPWGAVSRGRAGTPAPPLPPPKPTASAAARRGRARPGSPRRGARAAGELGGHPGAPPPLESCYLTAPRPACPGAGQPGRRSLAPPPGARGRPGPPFRLAVPLRSWGKGCSPRPAPPENAETAEREAERPGEPLPGGGGGHDTRTPSRPVPPGAARRGGTLATPPGGQDGPAPGPRG